MAKIKQLLPNFISDPLIFEWKTSPYCASTKKSSRQLWIGNALFIIFKVICVMQPDTESYQTYAELLMHIECADS